MNYGLSNDEKPSLLDITEVGHPHVLQRWCVGAALEVESTRGAANARSGAMMRTIGPRTLAASGCETEKVAERMVGG